MTSNVLPVAEHNLGRDLTLYTLGRIALVAAVMALLVLFDVPLLVAAAVAVVVALPLGMLVFRTLNHRVTAALADRGEDRRVARDRLRAELRGDQQGSGDQ